MTNRSPPTILRTKAGQLRYPIRLLWNEDERRLRSPIRIIASILLILTLADVGRRIQPSLLTDDGPVAEALNNLLGGIPQSAAIALGVAFAAILIDRRRVTDLGINVESSTWRRFGGGLLIGGGMISLSLLIGTVIGYYEIDGIQLTNGIAVWLLLVVVTGLSQLIIVITEELFVRGLLITNVTEGLDGLALVPRSVAAGVGIVFASFFFYLTHSTRGFIFGAMSGGIAVLLGVAYVLSGDLSVPIGIHFGMNFIGTLSGTNPQPATLVQLSSSTTVTESLLLPSEAVVVRLMGSVIGIAVLLWWYYRKSGKLQVMPSIACPTLRWHPGKDTPSESPK